MLKAIWETSMFLTMVAVVGCLPSNYEDIEDSRELSNGAKVDINQDKPQSNAIHVAHNIPVGSDVKIVQTSPYNTSVHVALNLAKDSKVVVLLSDAVNCALHVSVNSGVNCKVDVKVDRAQNTSVHLSFQNPVRTPVKLTMDSPESCQIHVSQNVPRESPSEVLLENPSRNHIHSSQSVPQSSPLTFTIEGRNQDNQIVVSQSPPEENSPLKCSPECPQEENSDDYQYADSGGPFSSRPMSNQDIETVNKNTRPTEARHPETNDLKVNGAPLSLVEGSPRDVTQVEAGTRNNDLPDCPGGDLRSCIEMCPDFDLTAFKACIKVCSTRCP